MGPQAEYTDRDVEGWTIVAFVWQLLGFLGISILITTMLTLSTLGDDGKVMAVMLAIGAICVVVLGVLMSIAGRAAISRRPNELKGRGLAKAADILGVFVALGAIAGVWMLAALATSEGPLVDVTEDTTTTESAPLLTFEECFSDAPEDVTADELESLRQSCAEAFPDGP